MSYREVTALRRAGRLEAAYAMAAYDLEREFSDWTNDAMFWVERDWCIRYLENRDTSKAHEKLQHLQQLLDVMRDEKGYAARALGMIVQRMNPNHVRIQQLTELSKNGNEERAYSEMEAMSGEAGLPDDFAESYGWVIYRFLKRYQQTLCTTEIERILASYLALANERPSLLHSQMLGLAGKIHQTHTDFDLLGFVERWGVNHFLDEDFESSQWNGKTLEPRVKRLLGYCSGIGCKLEELRRVFTANERISQEDIDEQFSRKHFFIINERKDNVDTFLQTVHSYLNAIEGETLRNQYHSIILSLYLNRLPENRYEDSAYSIDQWGCGNFRSEDWERQQGDKGIEFPSLAEKAIKSYLASIKGRGLMNVSPAFETLLRQSINRYHKDEDERTLARIMAARGEREAALSAYRHLLLRLNKFYVWKELAELTDDKSLKMSALCKALLAERNDDYLGEVHLMLAELMEESGYSYEARCELSKYTYTYNKHRWKVGPEYREIAVKVLRSTLDNSISIPKDNRPFYIEHSSVADEFVYAKIPWTTMVVTDLFTVERNGKAKKRAKLINKRQRTIVVPANSLSPSPEKGMCYDLKLIDDQGRKKVVLSRLSEKNANDILNGFRRKGYS